MSGQPRLIWLSLVLALVSVTQVDAHSLEEIQKELAKSKTKPSDALVRITEQYERAKEKSNTGDLDPYMRNLESDEVHLLQHQLLDKEAETGYRNICVDLLEKAKKLDRAIEALRQKGDFEKMKEMEKLSDQMHAFTSVNCTFIN